MRAPDCFTTSRIRSYSNLRCLAKSSGVLYVGSSAWGTSFDVTSGSASAYLISALNLSMIGFGVPVGAKHPNHDVNS